MTTRDPSPLDAEERALAARLGLHASDGPPRALDARILGIARASAQAAMPAVATAPVHHARRPRRRRWPAAMGLVASLALAVGVAWQLRPLPEAATVVDGTPAQPPVAAPAMRPETPIANASAADAAPRVAAREPAAAAAPARAIQPSTTVAAAGAEAAAGVRDGPSSAAVASAMPLPRPDPPPATHEAGATTFRQPSETTAETAASPHVGATVVGRKLVRGAPVPLQAVMAASDAAAQADAPATTFADDEVLDDSPPATADSPDVHREWLQRIRELRDIGRDADARASLAELRRRFPDLRVPDDLAGLADPPR